MREGTAGGFDAEMLCGMLCGTVCTKVPARARDASLVAGCSQRRAPNQTFPWARVLLNWLITHLI